MRFLRHLPHREVRTFACISRFFRPTVRHLIGTEGRRLVYRDAAKLEPLGRLKGCGQVTSEDAGLKPVLRAVRKFDRLVQALVCPHYKYRTEDLTAPRTSPPRPRSAP